MKKTGLCLFMTLVFSGCTGFAIKEKVVDKYYLIATDIQEQLTLSFEGNNEGDFYDVIVGQTVFAVGYNDEYIIVKQHPCNSQDEINKKITNFYIAPIHKKRPNSTVNNAMGPFNMQQFEDKRKELKIENVQFTIEYKDLE